MTATANTAQRLVVLTGGTSGIGRLAATELAARGAMVAVIRAISHRPASPNNVLELKHERAERGALSTGQASGF